MAKPTLTGLKIEPPIAVIKNRCAPDYERYEREKRALQSAGLNAAEYERRLREIAARCGV